MRIVVGGIQCGYRWRRFSDAVYFCNIVSRILFIQVYLIYTGQATKCARLVFFSLFFFPPASNFFLLFFVHVSQAELSNLLRIGSEIARRRVYIETVEL